MGDLRPTIPDAEPKARATAGDVARSLYRERRMRRRFFGEDASVFAEPCWDILLDLMAASEEGRPISVMSSCIASDVPTSTGQRHVGRLEKRGLITRRPDPNDARRRWLVLTPRAERAMRAFLNALAAERQPGRTSVAEPATARRVTAARAD